MSAKAKIGVIGGSGLYAIDGMKVLSEEKISTPWGDPSDTIVIGEIEGTPMAFLPRHGKGHRLTPTEVNSHANIAALKSLGVEQIVAFSAVGSLQEEIPPLDFILPAQIIDRTRFRPNTYFGNGVVAHVAFADPFCLKLQQVLKDLVAPLGIKLHCDKTLVCMEGPAFSTRAESHLYRSWGGDIINMSALPESKLAMEAEISYAMICMSTDYDCWREEEEEVTVETVIANLTQNAENAKRIVTAVAQHADQITACTPKHKVAASIITAPDARNPETMEKLRFLFPEL